MHIDTSLIRWPFIHRPMARGQRAFTLVELLAVVAIIGILVGGIGLILKGNNPGSALRASQSTLMSALSIARGQAALNQTNAMIIVRSDTSNNDVEPFLRSIRVVVETSSGSNVWKDVGGEIRLPQGIYVVPNAGIGGVQLTTPGSHLSDFFEADGSVAGVTITGVANPTFLRSKKITPLGTMENATGGALLVASGTLDGSTMPPTVKLDNQVAVRGFKVSNYGVATLINEGTSFDH